MLWFCDQYVHEKNQHVTLQVVIMEPVKCKLEISALLNLNSVHYTN